MDSVETQRANDSRQDIISLESGLFNGTKSLSGTLSKMRNTVEIYRCILYMSDKDIQNKWEMAIGLKWYESSVL